MDYYIEGESKMRGKHIKDTNKKLKSVLTYDISVTFDKSKAGCKLNSWGKKRNTLCGKAKVKKWLIRW